jgi:hypothetical protein
VTRQVQFTSQRRQGTNSGNIPERAWSEQYIGGSAEQERLAFTEMATQIMKVQLKNRKSASARGVPHRIDRAFHAKATLGVDDAELRFRVDLAPELQTGFAQPGAAYRALVRFSNASGDPKPDSERDLRGIALRVTVPVENQDDEHHDLLLTNFPVSHARNADQFVKFAVATAGGSASRVLGIARLVAQCGLRETVRMVKNVQAGRTTVGSVATETYWSRGAICWDDSRAVRYLLRPLPGSFPAPPPMLSDPNFLYTELSKRLKAGDVRFEFCVQQFTDEATTPIEDTSVEWKESDSPPIPIAELRISQRDLGGPDRSTAANQLNSVSFNPWNTTDLFRPLGNLNRARKAAYDASAAHRQQLRWHTEVPVRNVVLSAASRVVLGVLNRIRPWWRLNVRLGLLSLDSYRHVLRRDNLIDTEPQEAPPSARPVPDPPDEETRTRRTFDGSFNDLSVPKMGAVGATFGRNLPPDYRPELLNEPNPITVSQKLMHRETFRPATSLNLLAAAWIQFQVHDWVNHERYPLGQQDVAVPLPDGMAGWTNTPGGPDEQVMRIADNRPIEVRPDGTEVFANLTSHWWDGSEIYGSDGTKAQALRDGSKIKLTPEGYLPQDLKGQELTGFNESWWLGLSAMHTLFVREHNVLCEEMRTHYRNWSDDRIYHTARLIVSALIAKIHTVEWTPAILATKTIDVGLKSNWSGPPSNDWVTRLGTWLLDVHAGVGIPSTLPDHGVAPFSLTEDFVTVYRMHPLLPDDYVFRHHQTGDEVDRLTFMDIQGEKADDELRRLGLESTLYSFGISHPGAITLHNSPRALETLERNGEIINLSVVDLVRTRRRGVPRYNDFRAGLHMPRISRWEDLSADPETVCRLKEVYRTIDEVDTVVGLLAETPPDGFGFSDTAFRIFILMASRRLQSDRFLTVDFRPEIYSEFGMDWIAKNGMTSTIQRHCPELASLLPRDVSAFAPWRSVGTP